MRKLLKRISEFRNVLIDRMSAPEPKPDLPILDFQVKGGRPDFRRKASITLNGNRVGYLHFVSQQYNAYDPRGYEVEPLSMKVKPYLDAWLPVYLAQRQAKRNVERANAQRINETRDHQAKLKANDALQRALGEKI